MRKTRPAAVRCASLPSLIVACALGAFGCGQAGIVDGASTGGRTATGQAGHGGSSVISPPPGGDASTVSQGDAGVVKTHVECEGGSDCVCPPFNVAVMGQPGKWGAVREGDPPTALMDWLNSSSAGTAKVSNFTSRTTLTPELLAGYDLFILTSLSDDSEQGPWWTFSDEEVAAFRAWLENGGGVIALTGYASNTDEVRPVNQLTGFSGVTFNADDVYATCADWGICSCTHSLILSTWVTSDPATEKLTSNLKYIGYEHGRSVAVPTDGHVIATVEGPKDVMGAKVVGKGHVLLFGDEWITYTSQWTGDGNPSADDPNCAGKLPQDQYQTGQLWYNMIKWSSPNATCFKIVDTTNPVIVW